MSPTLFKQCQALFYVPFQLEYKDEGDKANSLMSLSNDVIIWSEKGISRLAWSHQFFLRPYLMVWLGFELTTSHSADRRSCNSANQVAVMYCCSVWDGLTQTFKIQKLQNRPARVITKSRYDGSAGPLLDMLGWGSALISQIKQKAVVKFKTQNISRM